MFLQKPFHLAAGTLFLALALAFTPVRPAAAGDESPPTAPRPNTKLPAISEPFGWQVQDARILDGGRTVRTQIGVLTNGYTIEASVLAQGKARVPKGKFRVTLTVFSPSQDMPGQKAGMWYVRGDWFIIDENAPPEAEKMYFSPAVVKGTLLAELPFNPTTDEGTIHATLRVPRLARARGTAHGTLVGNERFEGRIEMVLKP